MGKKCWVKLYRLRILKIFYKCGESQKENGPHKNSNTVGLEKKNVVGLILVLWARKK